MTSHRTTRSTRAPGRRGHLAHLQLEPLEDRRVPAVTVVPLGDLRAGTVGSMGFPSHPDSRVTLALGEFTYFNASNGQNGFELWRTDGTEAGTVLVKDIRAGAPGSNPQWLTPLSDTTFVFAAFGTGGVELWKSDGTDSGTVLVRDINPGAAVSDPQHLVRVGNFVYFSALTNTTGRELWRTDGTLNGTTLVADLQTGNHMTGVPRSSRPEQLAGGPGGVLYFTAEDRTLGRELFAKPATGPATMVRDIALGSAHSTPQALVTAGNWLYFTASATGAGNRELWRTDGTSANTSMVIDLNGSTTSFPAELTAFNGELYFAAAAAATGRELYRTDGTAAGTVLVSDIRAGATGSVPSELTVSGNSLYFTANNGTDGVELWRTDGTADGTALVRNINNTPRSAPSSPTGLVDLNGTLFFQADNGTNGTELWQSDGTSAGTTLVIDLVVGANGSGPQRLTPFGDRLFLYASEVGRGMEPHLALTDRPPAIEPIANRTDNEGGAINLPVHVSDPDEDEITLTAENLPSGITLVAGETGYALVGTLARSAAGVHTPVLRARALNREVTATFTWTVLDITVPSIDNPGPQGNNEGNVVSLWVFARDTSGDPVTFSATGLPPGLTMSPIPFPLFGGAAISGTVDPHAGAGSPYTVIVTATDGSHPVSTTFTWTIGDFTVPVVTNPGQQRKNEGNLVSLQIHASDAEGDTMQFTAENLPPGLVMFPDGFIFGRLTNRAAGTHDVTVRASDGQNSASTTFTWIIGDLNPPTVQHPGTQNNQAGATVSLQIVASDADNDPLVYTALGLPPGLGIHSDTGVISGTIAVDAGGSFNVTVRATDGTNQGQTHFVWNVQGLPHGGDLDSSFDDDGRATTRFDQYLDRAQATVVQPDGKVIAVGYTTDLIDGFHTGFALARYTAEGKLDETFGAGGRVVLGLSREDQAQAVLLQGDRILVAGFTTRATRDVVVLRYRPNGTLDTSFGEDGSGYVVLDFGGADTSAALARQEDGKIVVGGTTAGAGFSDFALARLTADGLIDSGFGTEGIVTTDLAGGTDVLTGLSVQPDQAIVAAGTARVAGMNQISAARFLPDGALDTTFGVDTGNGRSGKAFVPVGIDSGAASVAVQSDGRLILGGNSYDTDTGLRFTVLRMLANGDLDATFGTNGVTTTNLAGANEQARAMVVQADGKIILGGRADGPTGPDFALVRYTADGQLDLTFDFDGVVTTDFGFEGADELYGLALDGTRLIAVGSAADGADPGEFAVARYLL